MCRKSTQNGNSRYAGKLSGRLPGRHPVRRPPSRSDGKRGATPPGRTGAPATQRLRDRHAGQRESDRCRSLGLGLDSPYLRSNGSTVFRRSRQPLLEKLLSRPASVLSVILSPATIWTEQTTIRKLRLTVFAGNKKGRKCPKSGAFGGALRDCGLDPGRFFNALRCFCTEERERERERERRSSATSLLLQIANSGES